MSTLTGSQQRKITENWARAFPGLGIYKPLHLLRRVGPMLMGIALNRNEAGTCYKPIFHIHVLLKESRAILLNLASQLRSKNGVPDLVQVKWHDTKFEDAVRRMQQSCLLPTQGDIGLDSVLQAVERWLKGERWPYWPQVLEDRILLCAWSNRRDAVAWFIRDAEATLRSWPANVQQQLGGVDAWLHRVGEAVTRRKKLEEILASEIAAHKLQSIPVASLLVE